MEATDSVGASRQSLEELDGRHVDTVERDRVESYVAIVRLLDQLVE